MTENYNKNKNASGTDEYYFPILKCNTVAETMRLLKLRLDKRKILFVIDGEYDSLINNKLTDMIRETFEKDNCDIVSLFPKINGHENKEHESLFLLIDKLIESDLPRNGVIVAIGGGVVTDIAGFAACQFRRRVDYVRIPTTLLGQTDAGVGVKVGINYNGNKNILGAFYAPIFVINCREFIFDLDDVNFNSGIAEILKAGMVESAEIVESLKDHTFTSTALRNDEDLRIRFDSLTDEAVNVMKRGIMADPTENSFGVRSMDFGHSFSAGYESASGYKVPHGYAVAAEMIICTYISSDLGLLSPEETHECEKIFIRYGLLKYYHMIYPRLKMLFNESAEKMISHRAGNLNLVLPGNGCKAVFCNLRGTKDENGAGCEILLTKDELYSLYCTAADKANELAEKQICD